MIELDDLMKLKIQIVKEKVPLQQISDHTHSYGILCLSILMNISIVSMFSLC